MNGDGGLVAHAKFRVPRVPNATVRREGLLASLRAGAESPLSLVVAAPGSGKTALLADWVDSLGEPVAWMSCDPGDVDPSTFWHNVVLSVSLAWEDLAVAAAELREESSAERIAIGLANELARGRAARTIVVDDFHLAQADPRMMLAFVDALPPSARLVLGSRADPPFPLGRLRVQGRLLELRQVDLRFTHDEARELLALVGVELSDDAFDALMTLTEGWAAGVHLAGLRLQRDRDPRRLLRHMAETDHSLVDFLMSEVIDLLDPELVEFLMVTAELESFDAELCDAVQGRADSHEMLTRVWESNLFLVELDRDGTWYRYHHLFAQFLRGRLRAVARDRVPSIHRTAARAYRQRGDLMHAVQHSMAAGDAHVAMELLGAYVTSAWSVEEGTMSAVAARRWLHERGGPGQELSPQRVLVAAIVLNAVSAFDEVEHWLQRLDAAAGELDLESRFLLRGAWSFYFLHRGDPVGALEHALRAEALLWQHELDTVWVQALPFMLVQAELWLDDLDGADATLEAARSGPALPPVVGRVRLPALASEVALARGDLRDAERLARSALFAADQLGLDDVNYGRAEPELCLAAIAIERDALDEAAARLERAMRVSEGGRRPQVELLVHLQLAYLAVAQGRHEAAADALAEARGVLPFAAPPVLARIDRVETACALDQGDLARAQALSHRLPSSPRSDLLAARVRLETGDRASALDVLAAMTDRLSTRYLRIGHGLLTARALAPDDRSRSLAILEGALDLAQASGYRRMIVVGGAGLWELLEAIPGDRQMAGYVSDLLDMARRVVPPAQALSQSDLVEPLSDREVTVLRYLASRLTSTEIARELFLSVNTVRSHVKAIYRKLGVSSRAQAVERGRELGLG